MGLNAHAHLLIVSALTSAEATNTQTTLQENTEATTEQADVLAGNEVPRLLNFNHWNFYLKIAL